MWYLLIGGALGLLWWMGRKGDNAPESDTLPSGALEVGKDFVRVGNITRKGGSASWRARNPGNITWSQWAKKEGALGPLPWGKMQFAIWSTDGQGFEAILKLLQTDQYAQLTIERAMQLWTDSNNRNYIDAVAKAAGQPYTYPMVELDPAELRALASAMVGSEGWEVGSESARV